MYERTGVSKVNDIYVIKEMEASLTLEKICKQESQLNKLCKFNSGNFMIIEAFSCIPIFI